MRKPLIIGVLTLLLAACAGLHPPRPAGFEAYDSVVVRLTSDAPRAEPYTQALRDSIVAALHERRSFASIETGEAAPVPGQLILRINITRFVRVHDPLRIAIGRMAGSNEVGVDITLLDGGTGESLSRFHLTGESPYYPPGLDWPRGTIEIAMQRLGWELAGILSDWSSPADAGSMNSWESDENSIR